MFAHWTGHLHTHTPTDEASFIVWGWVLSLIVMGSSIMLLRAWFKRE